MKLRPSIVAGVGLALVWACGCDRDASPAPDDPAGAHGPGNPGFLDSDGDGTPDHGDPTPFGFSAVEARQEPLSMALHIHGSLSERNGTMLWHTTQASTHGIDVIWWSDHDTMLLMLDRQGGYDFDGGHLVETVPIIDKDAEHGFYITSSEVADLESSVLEGGPTGSGYYWCLGGRSTGSNDWSSIRYSYDGDTAVHHVPMLANAVARVSIRPEHAPNPDWQLRFEFTLSGNLHGTLNQIVYYIGPDDLTAHNDHDSLFVPVGQGLQAGEWATLAFPLTEDAAYFIEGVDQCAQAYDVHLGVRRGARSSVDIDDFDLNWSVDGEPLLQRQRDLIAEQFSDGDVTHFVGFEMTAIEAGQHINPLARASHEIPLYAYPPLSTIGAQTAVDYIHGHGGLAVCNHPLGADQKDLPVPDAQDAIVQAHLVDEWLPAEAYGCDAIEIGYLAREVDLAHHLMFWDELGLNGHVITGVGTSDQHVARRWPDSTNPFVTWVFRDEPTREGIIEQLALGRVFFGDPYRFPPGEALLDLWSEHGVVMGQVHVGDLDHVIHVEVGAIEPGWQLALVVDGEGHATTLLDGSEREVVFHVPRRSGRYQVIRAELRDLDGDALLLSNPIYLFPDPHGVPAARMAY